ncbi:MAG: CDC48 family AAA ATPase [Desulfobacterales bacterium]|nr:CDC48 family AAA ATPase [Desulfobacterales bacterium]
MEKTDVVKLKVTEALSKDVGRALARMGPEDMTQLGLAIGDIVAVEGKRQTVCKVMPAFKEMRDQSRIQLDGLTRENAGAGLDELVTIRKTTCHPAQKVSLAPATVIPGERDLKYIGSLLDGIPVLPGDHIRANLFGSRSADFKVEGTTPKGPVLINPITRLTIGKTREANAAGRVAYEDVGGLKSQLLRIREMIELPLRYPEVFNRLGIDAPKGVLLHGPPGCGKTLIARAIAHETDAQFFSISGPEVIHKFYGESEAHLRKIFDEASRKGPSIVFLDEIDAIAPRREKSAGDVEKRVVAQLLALMDGLNRRQHVIVIAATNIPNALDPALRRPGRFDREITIPIPDRFGRLEILNIYSRGMPLAPDVDMAHLSEITHGFVGADLEALCREAAMLCLRRIIPEIDFALSAIPYEQLAELEIHMDDFRGALREVEPSAIREVFVEVPNVGWDDVGGLDTVKTCLVEAVEWPLHYPHLFEQAGIRPAKGVLLSGPPGCGKTLIAKALASESHVNFISVKGPALLSKYVGESERAVREVFQKARQAAPCIVFFDEIDALVPVRSGSASDSHVSERVLSQLLTELDGIEELHGVLVLGATNRIDTLDPAVLRPGRFDEIIDIPKPAERERKEIFTIHLRNKPLEADISIDSLAAKTEGFSGAEISGLCHKAALTAVRRAVQSGRDTVLDDDSGLSITAGDLFDTLRTESSHGN